MGPGIIVDAARAASAGTALRAWGDVLGASADELWRGLRGEAPRTLDDGLAALRPVHAGSVRATGWELGEAFAWRNDDRCVERAALGVMSLLEREAGDIRAAMGELATTDARRGAIAVHFSPNFDSAIGRARLHAAPVFRTTDGDALVIDHLVSDAPDGVLPLAEWLRRTGGTDATARVVHPLHAPPLALRGGPGIPVSSKPISGDQYRGFASALARSWDEAAQRRLPAHQPIR